MLALSVSRIEQASHSQVNYELTIYLPMLGFVPCHLFQVHN